MSASTESRDSTHDSVGAPPGRAGAVYTAADTDWLLFLRPGAALLVEGVDEASLVALDDALHAADPSGAVLGALLAGGLATLPSFVFAETTPSGWRVLVRGSALAECDDETVAGADYTTWAERILTGDELALRSGASTGGRRLPLSDGIVPATAVTLRAGTSATSAASAARLGSVASAAEPPRRPATGVPGAAVPPISPAAPVPPVPPESAAPSVPPVPPESAASSPSSLAPPPLAPPPLSAPPVVAAQETPVSEHTIADFTSSGSGDAYAHLFEETVIRPIEAAAIREPEPEPTEAADPADGAPSGSGASSRGGDSEHGGDSGAGVGVDGVDGRDRGDEGDRAEGRDRDDEHDGMTVLSGDLRALRARAAAENPARPGGTGAGAGGPTALVLVFSSGQREHLTGSIIVGRSPSASKVSAGSIPRLVAIPDDPDLSRSHVRVDLSGDSAVVTDLHSRNGTSIELPGQAPQRLRAGVPSTVLPGTVIDLGGGLTITVTETDGA